MATLENVRDLAGNVDPLINILNARTVRNQAAESATAQQGLINEQIEQIFSGQQPQIAPVQTTRPGAPGNRQQKAFVRLMALDSALGKSVFDVVRTGRQDQQDALSREVANGVRTATFVSGQKDEAGQQRALRQVMTEKVARGEDTTRIQNLINMAPADRSLQFERMKLLGKSVKDILTPEEIKGQSKLGKLGADLKAGLITQKQFNDSLKGGAAEKGTFTKGPPILIRQADDTPAFATIITDSRSGETTTVVSEIPGTFVNRLGLDSNEVIQQAIAKETGVSTAGAAVDLATKPEIAGEVKKAQVQSAAEEARSQDVIQRGVEAAEAMPNIRRSIELLKGIETGGIDKALLSARAFLGIESADEAELGANLGKAVISQLREVFGAAFTAAEGQELKSIEAGLGKSTAGNKRVLRQLLRMMDRKARKAIRRARKGGDTDTAKEIQDAMKLVLGDPDPDEDVSQMSDEQLRVIVEGPQ